MMVLVATLLVAVTACGGDNPQASETQVPTMMGLLSGPQARRAVEVARGSAVRSMMGW
jgi:hypothetical protein